MAFDVNDPADLATLKGLVPDPALGTDVILASLNDYVDSAGVPLHVETGPDNLTASKLLNMVYQVNVSAGDQFRIQLLFEMAGDASSNIDAHRADLALLGNNGLDTKIAELVRPLNLAEINFSDLDEYGAQVAVRISRADWLAARSS
jgi:hypothetical protein